MENTPFRMSSTPVVPAVQAEIATPHQGDFDFLIRKLRAARLQNQRLRQENESLEEDLIDERNLADELGRRLRELRQQHKAELAEIAAQLRSALVTRRDMLSDRQELETRDADALSAEYALVQKIEATMVASDRKVSDAK